MFAYILNCSMLSTELFVHNHFVQIVGPIIIIHRDNHLFGTALESTTDVLIAYILQPAWIAHSKGR